MKKILFTVLFLLMMAAPARGQVVQGAAADPGFGTVASPQSYSLGFSKSFWAHSLKCMIAAYGTTVFTQNKIRCFEPLSNTWKVIFAGGNAGSAEGDQTPGVNPSGRDNEVSMYVENAKEFWVWGGTHGNMSGRFNLSACAPTPTDGCATLISAGPGDSIPVIEVGFVGAPAPAPGGGSDSGAAWNKDCDGGVGCGMIAFGNDAVAAKVYIIERNTAAQITALGGTSNKYCPNGSGAPFLWIVCEFTGTKPPSRVQALGSVVAVGNDFYVGAGTAPAPPINVYRADLWKYTRSTNAFTAVPGADPAPYAGEKTMMTYDSDLNMIVMWGERTALNLSFYQGWDLTNNVWADLTPILTNNSIGCRNNQTGSYSPTAKRHIYEGGGPCDGGASIGTFLTQVSPSGFTSAAGRLYMAPGLWVSKPYPTASPAAGNPTFRTVLHNGVIGETGYGIPSSSGIKHQRIRWNPTDGRLWFMHGDWFGGEFSGNFNTQIFSYNISAPYSVNEATRWRLEWPYCGIGGGNKAPIFQDESPLSLDIARQKIIYVGGYNSGTDAAASSCRGFGIVSDFYGNAGPGGFLDADHPCSTSQCYLEFDIATRRFAQPANRTVSQQPTHQGVWNPTTNEHIVFHASPALFAAHMAVSTGAWNAYEIVCATSAVGVAVDTSGDCNGFGNKIAASNLINEQMALDVAGQVIWIIDPTPWKQGAAPNLGFRLLKYNIATHAITNYGFAPLPIGSDTAQTPGAAQPHFCYSPGPVSGHPSRDCYNFPYYRGPNDSTMLVWDTVNQSVIWPASSNGGIPITLVFKPSIQQWTIDNGARDRPTETMFGSNGEYIPELNVMMIYGGQGWVPGGGYGGSSVDEAEMGHECPSCSLPMLSWWMYRLGGTAPLNTTVTLTVNDMNATGVAIVVTPNDNNAQGNGTTSFSRIFTPGNMTAVTLTAPATVGTNPFSDWTGCDSRTTTAVANDTCHVVMTSSKTVTAVYTTALITRTLTITSSPTGIPMTILPLDNTGAGDCPATPCTRVYNNGANVTVTAPLISGANSYTLWTGNWNSLNGRIASVTMSANKTVTAPYVTCATSWRNSTQFSNEQGQCGWSYRDSTGALMTFANGQWSGPEGSLGIGAGDLMHPGPTRTAIRRFTSPIAGAIKITGNVSDADLGGGDGVDVSITQAGSVTATLLPVTTVNTSVGTDFDISATVAIGDIIDFKVAPRANSDYDTSRFTAMIAPVVVVPSVATVRFGDGADGAAVKFGAGATFGN